DVLDIGGESTRPYSAAVSLEEELRRVIPVIESVHRQRPEAIISVDTSKAAVAGEAINRGAEIINDITGLAGDVAMIRLAVASSAAVCIMHMQGTPQTMQDEPQYEDVVSEVHEFLRERRDALLAAGID